MTGRHRIRRLQRKLVLPEREQEVSDGPGRVAALLRVECRQHVGHGGARQCFVRSGDESLQIGGVHPRAHFRKSRSLLRSCLQRTLARMTGHAVQFFDEHLTAQFRVERSRGQAGDNGLGPGPEHQHARRKQDDHLSPGLARRHPAHSGRWLDSHEPKSERTPSECQQQIAGGTVPSSGIRRHRVGRPGLQVTP